MLEECAADTSACHIRFDVEVVDHGLAEPDEGQDQPVFLPDPRLLLIDNPAEPDAMLLERVQRRQERKRSERALIQLGDRINVTRPSLADHRRERIADTQLSTMPSKSLDHGVLVWLTAKSSQLELHRLSAHRDFDPAERARSAGTAANSGGQRLR
jgi:hypothetical protein